jgi:osmotically-inducible protein OsmY
MRAICAAVLCICLTAAQTGCVSFGGCGLRECSADAKISADVRTLFAQNPELGGPNLISVQTVHGVVYLRGVVSTPYQIAEAGSIAAQAPGVAAVRNLVVIDNSK